MAQVDMFLKIEGARQGPIKGEAQDDQHPGEIDVVAWSWGMRGQSALSGAGSSARTSFNELNILKRVDSASTGLMAAMRNNEPIRKAVLTVRKAGGTALEYFRITLENGRVTLLEVKSDASSVDAELTENLALSYQKINVEYVPQGADGQARGGMVFEAETRTT
jgi:type VI secretion system secreted protein Hcp